MDRAHALERRHRTSQLVGFRRRETGGDNRDLHRLFLKQRHAKGFPQHLLKLFGGIAHLLQALTAAQIGMHHIALNGTRPHDGDLDHKIIKRTWAQARQHRHLRAAFNLEYADGVGATDHVVDARLFGGQARQREALPVMALQQVKPAPQARQHAKRQNVDLENAQRIEIVLVPHNRRAPVHRSGRNRHDFVKPRLRDDKASGVLRQMTRKARDFLGKPHHMRDVLILRIQPRRLRGGACLRRSAPDGGGHRRQRLFRKAKHLTNLTQR